MFVPFKRRDREKISTIERPVDRSYFYRFGYRNTSVPVSLSSRRRIYENSTTKFPVTAAAATTYYSPVKLRKSSTIRTRIDSRTKFVKFRDRLFIRFARCTRTRTHVRIVVGKRRYTNETPLQYFVLGSNSEFEIQIRPV